MKIFIELKKRLALLGIKPISENRSKFIIKNVTILISFVSCFVAMCAFVLFEPKSLMDFGNSFYGAACTALNTISFSSNVLQSAKIFKLFSRLEEFVEEREFYSNTKNR